MSPLKKTLRASEQERDDVARARRRWLRQQGFLDPARLVFIDETATSTNMVRPKGRCLRGDRLIGSTPHGHWKTMTLVAGLRNNGIVAPLVLDGSMNGTTFLAYVEQFLAPTLNRDDIVIMDMYGRPRRSKKNLWTGAARSRVLTCIRPVMRRNTMPLARMGVRGSDPKQPGALVALIHDLVFPTPSLRPLRHTFRLTFLRRRQPRDLAMQL